MSNKLIKKIERDSWFIMILFVHLIFSLVLITAIHYVDHVIATIK